MGCVTILGHDRSIYTLGLLPAVKGSSNRKAREIPSQNACEAPQMAQGGTPNHEHEESTVLQDSEESEGKYRVPIRINGKLRHKGTLE